MWRFSLAPQSRVMLTETLYGPEFEVTRLPSLRALDFCFCFLKYTLHITAWHAFPAFINPTIEQSCLFKFPNVLLCSHQASLWTNLGFATFVLARKHAMSALVNVGNRFDCLFILQTGLSSTRAGGCQHPPTISRENRIVMSHHVPRYHQAMRPSQNTDSCEDTTDWMMTCEIWTSFVHSCTSFLMTTIPTLSHINPVKPHGKLVVPLLSPTPVPQSSTHIHCWKTISSILLTIM